MSGKRKSGTQPMNREEVFLMFHKWLSEEVTLECVGSLIGWGVILKGKILSASREEVAIGVKNKAVVFLRLDIPDLQFMYGEMEFESPDIPGAMQELTGLSVGLPLRLSVSTFLRVQREGTKEDFPRENLFFAVRS